MNLTIGRLIWLTPLALMTFCENANAQSEPGKIVSVDVDKKLLVLKVPVYRYEVVGGTTFQPISYRVPAGTTNNKYKLSGNVVVRFTLPPTFVGSDGKERMATEREKAYRRGSGNISGYSGTLGSAMEGKSATLTFRGDAVSMIIVNGSEQILEKKK